MKNYLFLGKLTKKTTGGSPMEWPSGATKALEDLGISINHLYSLSGPDNFLLRLDLPDKVTATQIKEAVGPFGVEGEVYIFSD